MIELSVLIATTYDRRPLFNKLYAEFVRQSEGFPVEVLFEEDGKQISIGKKRQKLLNRAIGNYITYFDSDDFPMNDYIPQMLVAIEKKPDCVGFLIKMTTNNMNPQVCCHSLKYKVWAEKVDGYDYVRSPGHFNPIRREIALKVGFKDMRFGEDHVYSKGVTHLCKTEVFIDKELFHYRYSNKVPHRQKYGIR